jgi:hypothetical protein
MLCQIGEAAGCAMLREITPMGVEPHVDLADAAGDQ